MSKKALILGLEFVAITVPLTWLWMVWGRDAYTEVFNQLAPPLLAAVGYPNSRLGAVPHRFINYVPFLALMLITPGLSPLRRSLGTLLGCGVIFLGHVAFVAASIAAYARWGETPEAVARLFPMLLLCDALPFVLWAGIAHRFVREAAGRAMARVFADPRESSSN